MSLVPGSTALRLKAENLFDSVMQFTRGLFGHTDFSPEESLINTPSIDPYLIPRAPMSAENIDVTTLNELGKMGLKRGKLISAQSHPELFAAWQMMSARAGLAQPPQLILTESKTVNALTISPEEVAITTSLLKLLDLREVTAVLGHELGHETSDHTMPRAIALGLFGGGGVLMGDTLAHRGGFGALIDHSKPNPAFFKRMVTRVFGHGGSPTSVLGGVAYMALGGTAGTMVANQIAVRPTELDADRKGAMISGDPQGLINALTKLEASRAHGAVGNFLAYAQSGYPTTATRIERLRGMVKTMGQVEIPAEAVARSTVSNVPGHQIHTIAHAERVGTPVVAHSVAG